LSWALRSARIAYFGGRKLKEFRQFVVARSPEEATNLKRSIGPGALYVAGGTSFVPFVKTPVEVLIDISKLGYTGVIVGGDKLVIGAATRIADLLVPELHDVAPILIKAGRRLGTPLIRNMATPGGNLAYAFLPSDLSVAFLAAGARIEILGEHARTVRVEDLLDDGWLAGDDLISKIVLEKQGAGRGAGFAKFGRGEVDIAIVSAAAMLKVSNGEVGELRLAVGQSSSMPSFLREVAGEAIGEGVSSGLIERIAEHAAESVAPREDYRASAEYRKHLIKVMVGRAFAEAAVEAGATIAD
jgi:carbon-monoxide dehydrogenase medium subunit